MKKLLILLLLAVPFTALAGNKDSIREARLEACKQGYKNNKARINEIYKHDTQNPIVRCATMMTLQFAFESNYWKSPMCINTKNCFWIKEPWRTDIKVNYKVWNNRFLIFDNFDDGNKAYAILYFKWHFNKNINELINGRSTTDQIPYINFVKKNYWKTFWEVQKIYDNM